MKKLLVAILLVLLPSVVFAAVLFDVDLNDGNWHDVVMTWEQSGSDMVLKIAVDGGTAGGETKTVEASLDTDYLYIGNRTFQNWGCLGTMSDVWIKTTADSI